MAEPWRNRIVAEGMVDPAAVMANPLNWRVHPKIQRQTLQDSLDTIGWIQKPVINRSSGHMIDGHLRIAAAIARGEALVPVTYVDLTEEEERAALASLDPMSGMAVTDGAKLTELLTELEIGSGALDAFLGELRQQAEGSVLAEATKDPVPRISKGSSVVKAVIAVSDMNLIERALAESGATDRGDALLHICRVFLNEKGQHDPIAQNLVTLQPFEAHPETGNLGDARGDGGDMEKGIQRDPPRRRVRRKARKG